MTRRARGRGQLTGRGCTVSAPFPRRDRNEGWTTDDLDMILDACAEDFVCDDPQEGRFTKARFPEYWEESLSGEKSRSDVVVREAGGVETGWCWWRWTPEGKTAEEGQQGAGLVKADADGVHLDRQAYYK